RRDSRSAGKRRRGGDGPGRNTYPSISAGVVGARLDLISVQTLSRLRRDRRLNRVRRLEPRAPPRARSTPEPPEQGRRLDPDRDRRLDPPNKVAAWTRTAIAAWTTIAASTPP